MTFHKDIDSAETKKLIDENINNNEFKIIDVRTEKEYKSGKIDNAILINIHDADFVSKINKLDKNNTYLVYCRSGSRSKIAMNIMKSLGFEKIYNLKKGVISL